MTVLKSLVVKIDTKGLKKLSEGLDTLRKSSLYVGIQHGGKGDKRPDGLSNSDLGLIHEKGTSDGRIPARPSLGPAITERMGAIKAEFKSAMRAALAGDQKEFGARLEVSGMNCESAVKKYIVDSSHFVPNAPSTLAKKFPKDKPLIDSGNFKNAITSFVIKD